MRTTIPIVFVAFATLTVARKFGSENGRDRFANGHEDEYNDDVNRYRHGVHARDAEPDFKEASWFEDRHGKHAHHARDAEPNFEEASWFEDRHKHQARDAGFDLDDDDNFDPSAFVPKTAHETMMHHPTGAKPTDASRGGWGWLGYKKNHERDPNAKLTAHEPIPEETLHPSHTHGSHGLHGHPIDEYADFHSREGHHHGNHWERDIDTSLNGYDLDDDEDEDDDAGIYARDAHHHRKPHHKFSHNVYESIYPRGEPTDADEDDENGDQAYYDAGDDGDDDYLDGTVTDDDTDYPDDDVGDEGYAQADDNDDDDDESSGVFARNVSAEFRKHEEQHHPSHVHKHPTEHEKAKPTHSKRGWNLFPW